MSMINLMLGRVEHEKKFNNLWSISIYADIVQTIYADVYSQTHCACLIYILRCYKFRFVS